jgi:uncharacterized membrane protein YhaH (DUF805 family)
MLLGIVFVTLVGLLMLGFVVLTLGRRLFDVTRSCSVCSLVGTTTIGQWTPVSCQNYCFFD